MWRAGFGPSASQLKQIQTINTNDLYAALKKAAQKAPLPLDVADNYLKGLFIGAGEIGKMQKSLDADSRKRIREQHRDDIKSLNLKWLDEMVDSPSQLREKMAFFWHDHFASRNINIFYQQQLLDIIRSNALGSFRTLLHEVSKSAAIIFFLNAQQNKKDHPNENFAREVMELFTLGRGKYGEKDIKEAARAFTGWGANAKGEFIFRRFQHDKGNKTIFGKTGNFDGEAVLDMILDQEATAFYITKKIYSFFVNENIDDEKCRMLSKRFFQSDYNISGLMDDIFTSNWFYEPKNMGTRIKSPIELLAGIQRMLPMEMMEPESLLVLQRIMGQVLFYPPNVAGWPGGKAWIDSSSLMFRLRVPHLMCDMDDLVFQPKTDDDQMMGMNTNQRKRQGKTGKKIRTTIDWDAFLKNFNGMNDNDRLTALAGTLLQVELKTPKALFEKYIQGDSSSKTKLAALHIMSLPEYQLC